MKIVLETIPVWDGLKKNDECFLCTLMKEAEKDALSYYLSSAIMTPEVRVETNTYGFCKNHFRMMAEANKPQVLSLIMDTYYDENNRLFYPDLDRLSQCRKPGAMKKLIDAFERDVREREKGCLVCTRMNDRLYRYCYTVASLFKEDPDFKKALTLSKGFCVDHTIALSRIAKDALSGDDLVGFCNLIFSLLRKSIERVQKDDLWMTQKYKSENKDKPWNGCEDAQKRAVYKLIGEGEVYDPIDNKKSRI